MAKKSKRKTAKKTVKKTAKKTPKKKAAKAKPRKKAVMKARPKSAKTARKPARRVEEPSSGAASSSLDPKRAGRLTVERPGVESRRGRLSGDDQGISRIARDDSESVEELLEEGQAFEAEVIEGVEDAPDADQGEVRTHEVPEDDVPGEYEDRDRF